MLLHNCDQYLIERYNTWLCLFINLLSTDCNLFQSTHLAVILTVYIILNFKLKRHNLRVSKLKPNCSVLRVHQILIAPFRNNLIYKANMDIDDDDMDQAPSSSTGVKGDKKRFEVKKVRKEEILCLNFNDISLLCEIVR